MPQAPAPTPPPAPADCCGHFLRPITGNLRAVKPNTFFKLDSVRGLRLFQTVMCRIVCTEQAQTQMCSGGGSTDQQSLCSKSNSQPAGKSHFHSPIRQSIQSSERLRPDRGRR